MNYKDFKIRYSWVWDNFTYTYTINNLYKFRFSFKIPDNKYSDNQFQLTTRTQLKYTIYCRKDVVWHGI